ncbi:MAG TPA: exodeoxyribonuclease VII small subunit [Candidatus Marinimicrobia bacterium]|nr:exodeoxyribonuclease VII small subunit [Candidatus Neomarinimicrobiota bacterium]
MNKNMKSFEEALNELETLLTRLESGDVPLDEMLELYERGVTLSKYCRKALEHAREKLQIITESLDDNDGQE